MTENDRLMMYMIVCLVVCIVSFCTPESLALCVCLIYHVLGEFNRGSSFMYCCTLFLFCFKYFLAYLGFSFCFLVSRHFTCEY